MTDDEEDAKFDVEEDLKAWFGKGKKGGRSSNRRGKGRPEKSHDEKLSRKLSNLLRHRVHANGLTDCLRTDGYVPLSRVLALPGFVGRTEEEIRSVVKTNGTKGNKTKRFPARTHSLTSPLPRQRR